MLPAALDDIKLATSRADVADMSRIEVSFSTDLPAAITDEQAAEVEKRVTSFLREPFNHQVAEAVGDTFMQGVPLVNLPVRVVPGYHLASP